jgi:V/A-type H+-transporting ATPase subunit A
MGLNVALMADSTSRWAEALRELSARLEEMPLEEGFPAYLAYRLAEFYERAGSVKTLSSNIGSVSIFASISPPGGDFSEPVTTHTKRFIRAFWALDKELANARHYPSISWIDSYSEYVDILKDWYNKEISSNWFDLRSFIMELLQKEQRLLGIVKLVGVDVLPHSQRLILEICNIFKNIFLQQNAFDEVDAFSSPKKQFLMLKIIVEFYKKSDELIRKGITIVEIKDSSIYKEIVRMKRYKESQLDELENLYKRITTLEEEFGVL